MKIVHVIASLARRDGGPPKACFEMARALARRGHEVSIYTTNKDGPRELDVPTDRPVVRDDVLIRYFPVRSPRLFSYSPALAEALELAIPRAGVVHAHGLYLHHDAVVGRVCRRFGVPYLLTPHGVLDPYLYRRHRGRKTLVDLAFQNRVTRGAARLHFITGDEKKLAEPVSLGVPGSVIPIGLDPDEYADLPPRGSFRSRHVAIGDRPMLLFYGRLNFKKGLDILCDAFARVNRSRPETRLVISGPDDGMEGQVRQWLAERRVSDKVVFTGMLTGQEGRAALQDADLFVLPSYSENFGIAVIEALACGTPVAISDHVNLCHEVEEAGAGWVTAAESNSFATAMDAALADPEESRQRGERGRRLVIEKYAWPRIAADMERLYNDVIAEAGASESKRVARTRAALAGR